MSYRAPVKDMLFDMQHLAGLQTLTEQIPAFADYGIDTAQAVLEECAKLNEDVVAPTNVEGDKNPSYWKDGQVFTSKGFKEAFRQFAEGGWQGLQHPTEYGGQGLAQDHRCRLWRDGQQCQLELRAVPAADRWRDRGALDGGLRRAKVHLHPAPDRR